MEVHSFNLLGRQRWISEFEASMIYRVRTSRNTPRNPVSKREAGQKQNIEHMENSGVIRRMNSWGKRNQGEARMLQHGL